MGRRWHLLAVVTIAAVLAAVAIAGTARPSTAPAADDARPAASFPGGTRFDRSGGGTAPEVFATTIDQTVSAGVLTPTSGIVVANLTIRPGSYLVRFSFDARFESAFRAGELRCGLVDSNGGGSFLAADPVPLRSGNDWVQRSYFATLSLPDLTLGIRCYPSKVGLARASFRNITLSITAT